MSRIVKTMKAVNSGIGGLKVDIPKEMQIRLGWKPGDTLRLTLELNQIVIEKEGDVRIRPLRD